MKIESTWDFMVWLTALAGIVIFILLVIYYFFLRDKGSLRIKK